MAGGRRVRGPILAPSQPVGEAAAAALAFHLGAFAAQEAGARDGAVEAVHQLRVATRRLRATLRLFAPALPADGSRRAREELAWLGRTIGAVRDLDVFLDALLARAPRLAPADREALAPLEALLRARRAAAHAALVRALDGPRCRELIARLRALGGARQSSALGDVAVDLAAPLLRAVHRAGRRLNADAPAEAFHRLRVRVKRLRYALETLQALGGPPADRMIRRLEAMQEVLGRHEDAAGQAARLRELASSPELPARTVFAMGALARVLARRARRSRRRFWGAWRRLDRRRLRVDVRRELARHRRPRRPLRLVRQTGT
jgi:CHAD domain-containing protein